MASGRLRFLLNLPFNGMECIWFFCRNGDFVWQIGSFGDYLNYHRNDIILTENAWMTKGRTSDGLEAK